MAGIIQNIEEKFKGGKKEGQKHDEFKGEGHAQYIKPGHGYGEHKPEQKEGFIDKIKGRKEKKKKGRKNKGHGHDHGDSSNSSSDSD